MAAHLYVTTGVGHGLHGDRDGAQRTNTASCQLGVTAYDPAGVERLCGHEDHLRLGLGDPGRRAAADAPPARRCSTPRTSARPRLRASAAASACCSSAAIHSRAAMRRWAATTWSVGAYGGCEDTQSGRPIFSNTGGNTITLQLPPTLRSADDGRIADIDFEGDGAADWRRSARLGDYNVPNQITLSNLYSNGNTQRLLPGSRGQPDAALIESVMTGMIDRHRACSSTSCGEQLPERQLRVNCGQGSSPVIVDYLAPSSAMSSMARASRAAAAAIETFRISACRFCVITNNTIENANNVGAAPSRSTTATPTIAAPPGRPVYTELVEISDNVFGGTSGAQLTRGRSAERRPR